MSRDGLKSGLVWLGVTAAVSGAVVFSGARDGGDPRSTVPPGHDANACGDRRAHPTARGPRLPYELDDDTVRFVVRAEDRPRQQQSWEGTRP